MIRNKRRELITSDMIYRDGTYGRRYDIRSWEMMAGDTIEEIGTSAGDTIYRDGN